MGEKKDSFLSDIKTIRERARKHIEQGAVVRATAPTATR